MLYSRCAMVTLPVQNSVTPVYPAKPAAPVTTAEEKTAQSVAQVVQKSPHLSLQQQRRACGRASPDPTLFGPLT